MTHYCYNSYKRQNKVYEHEKTVCNPVELVHMPENITNFKIHDVEMNSVPWIHDNHISPGEVIYSTTQVQTVFSPAYCGQNFYNALTARTLRWTGPIPQTDLSEDTIALHIRDNIIEEMNF